jgi:hypothetical protein
MAFLPFSDRARRWEIIADDLRSLARLRNGSNIDPEALASRVGLHLVDVLAVLSEFPIAERDHLLITAKDRWSGGVLPLKLPNGKYICMLNPTHPPRRNRITLMEETVHIHRRHTPTGLREIAPGLRVRTYDQAQEAEAYGVGAALLLPWGRFYHSLDTGTPVEEISEEYDVTSQLVQYRIKVTGASNLYRNRCRS